MKYNNPHQDAFFNERLFFWICLLLVIATLSVYWPLGAHQFVYFDDDLYILDNPMVQAGLTPQGFLWSFTTTHAVNWHPLTWLSHMLDIQLYGMNPGAHHLTNLFFHIINSLLLFAVLRKMTGALWQSVFVAALFAVHPLHVESVAWVSERKDVLSTFFWLLVMLSYTRYVERPGFRRYLPIFVFFVLGLMAKPMLVTLPFVLLLMDYWPLGRFQNGNVGTVKAKSGKYAFLIFEKIPLFVLAAISCGVTLFVQQKGGAVVSAELYPFSVRFSNALVAYGNYLFKMVWPHPLAIFYPHPGMPPVWKISAAALLLIGISLFSIKYLKRFPYVFTGWFWFVGTLVPVIGIVQVGGQAVADRYTYVPLIGMFIIVSWGASDLFRRWSSRPPGIAAAAIGVLLILMVLAGFQVRYWENSITLFEHAVKVTSDNKIAHNNLGVTFEKEGRRDEALHHFLKALQIDPIYADAHNNLAFVLGKKGRIKESFNHYEEALRLNPNHFLAQNNLGAALDKQGRTAEAITHYKKALLIKPDYAIAHNNIGAAFFSEGKIEAAVFHFREALRVNPNYTLADNNLKKIMGPSGETETIIEKLQDALKRHPRDPGLYYQLGNLYRLKNEPEQAKLHYEKALAIDPEFVPVLNRLALMYATKGEYKKTRMLLQKSIALKPDQWEPCYYLAGVFARQNHVEQSVGWLKKAVAKGFDNWDFLKSDKNLENIRATAYYQELISRN